MGRLELERGAALPRLLQLRREPADRLAGGVPLGDPHLEAVNRCAAPRAARRAARRVRYRPPNPLRSDRYNDPEPDVALRRPGTVGGPRPGNVLPAIEVAATSVADDHAVTVPLYARSGIPETWRLTVRDGALAVAREPGPAGSARTPTPQPDQRVAAAAVPDLVLRVADRPPPPDLERWRARGAARPREPDPAG